MKTVYRGFTPIMPGSFGFNRGQGAPPEMPSRNFGANMVHSVDVWSLTYHPPNGNSSGDSTRATKGTATPARRASDRTTRSSLPCDNE